MINIQFNKYTLQSSIFIIQNISKFNTESVLLFNKLSKQAVF